MKDAVRCNRAIEVNYIDAYIDHTDLQHQDDFEKIFVLTIKRATPNESRLE